MPHSPQRPAEHRRPGARAASALPHEKDGFLWFCEKCGNELYEEYFHLTDIVTQLPPVFEHFYGNEKHTTCGKCGTRATAPSP